MIQKIKRKLYFPVAYYFYFFAKIKLSIWNPEIICITGSSGKTTLLHLLESQIENAHFSHHANSAFGIPFDILSLKRKSFSIYEWPIIFLKAPLNVFKKPYPEKLYIVEADCDRPGEGKFLSELLKPDYTLWISSDATHTINFEDFDKSKFVSVKDAISYEYGFFIEKTKNAAIINSDSDLIKNQIKRTRAKIINVSLNDLSDFIVNKETVEFKSKSNNYKLPFLLPKETFYSLEMTKKLSEILKFSLDEKFSKLTLPPGRSSIFKGIKNTTIIDSSYNSSYISLKSMLDLLHLHPSKNKWAVIGDILELGEEEKEEHEKIAEIVNKKDFEQIILVGPRTQEYTFPLIKNSKTVTFTEPKEALEYIKENLKGNEVILFKGARFLEGVIEHLLINKNDIKKLCRRDKIWQKRRERWGL